MSKLTERAILSLQAKVARQEKELRCLKNALRAAEAAHNTTIVQRSQARDEADRLRAIHVTGRTIVAGEVGTGTGIGSQKVRLLRGVINALEWSSERVTRGTYWIEITRIGPLRQEGK